MKKCRSSALATSVLFLFGLAVGIIPQVANAMKAKPEPTVMKKAVQAEKPERQYLVTFVELGSVNCIPCKMMQPVMAEIEKEYGAQVKVMFYDVWTRAGEPFAEKYQIRAIPTQVFLDKNGTEYFRHMGFFPKAEIVKVLQKQGVK
jgi:thioredoxin 1